MDNLYFWGAIGIILFLIAIAIILVIIIKRRKKKKAVIPEEIINDFNLAEEKLKGGVDRNGTTNPYSILWEIAERNRVRKSSQSVAGTDTTVDSRKLLQQPSGRQDIQTGNVESFVKDSSIPRADSVDSGRPKATLNSNFLSKFRRRK